MRLIAIICLLGLSSGLPIAGEPLSYRLERHDGRIVLADGAGRAIPWTAYAASSETNIESWKLKADDFLAAGARVFQLSPWPHREYWWNAFWSTDGASVKEPQGKVPYADQVAYLLSKQPDACFIIRFGVTPPSAWKKAHPDEYMRYRPLVPFGRKEADKPVVSENPSLASGAYLAAIDRMIRDTVAWCESQPWRDRILGYAIFPYGEGLTEIGCDGLLFDTSLPMRQAFRAWVARRYASDDELRAAWRDPDVTRETVAVPTETEWFAKRATLKLPHFPDPALTVRERDYFFCAREAFRAYVVTMFAAMDEATQARPCLKGFDILKQPMQGWMLQPSFHGIWTADTLGTHGAGVFASGSFGIADLLDHPGLDMLQTPGCYFNRAMGYAWEAEGLTDSLALRGKTNFMEGDMRTWVHRRHDGTPTDQPVVDAGTARTPAEAAAAFDRAAAWAISRNQMFYYMNVSAHNWWFRDDSVAASVKATDRAVRASLTLPFEETRDALCVVLDDSSPLWEDFTGAFQHVAVRRQLEEGVALSGVPYRIHLKEDLARPDFPDYKCWLFPNLFEVDAATEALIRRKVFRNGNVAIFGPATGIIRDGVQSAAGASALLGVPMELTGKSAPRRTIIRGAHPIIASLPVMTFGSDIPFGPLLTPKVIRFDPERDGATALGDTFFYYFFDRPGLFVKGFGRCAAAEYERAELGEGDYTVVFTAAVPLPPEFLRACCRHAGCTIWSETNAVVYANARFVGIHLGSGAEHAVTLPLPARVTDMKTGKAVPVEGTVIRFKPEGGSSDPVTTLFRLDPIEPRAEP